LGLAKRLRLRRQAATFPQLLDLMAHMIRDRGVDNHGDPPLVDFAVCLEERGKDGSFFGLLLIL
jgi:hypothetical protein